MGTHTRICLVNPRLEGAYPPLGLAYIAAYLLKYGSHKYDIRILDGNCADVFREIQAFKPQIVGFTAMSLQIKEALSISAKVRQWDTHIYQVIGGIHVSAVPEMTLRKGSFDVAVLGEGEQTFREIVDGHISNGLSPENLKEIDGVAFMKDGEVGYTSPKAAIVDMDSIPHPARDLIDMKHYLSHYILVRGSGYKTATVHSSRGCPYQCVFCSCGIVFNKVRYFSPRYVVAEIDELVSKYKARFIFFTDDTFIIDKKRVRTICESIIEHGIAGKVDWEVQARAELIDWNDLELLKLMKKAGCVRIDYGFESGSDRILRFLKKGVASVVHNQKAIEVTKASGLKVLGTFMLGTLGETDEEIEETKSFIVKNIDNIEHFQTFITTPFPGAELYDMCRDKKIVEEDYIDQLEEEQKQSGLKIYSDTVSRQKVVGTLEFLNRLALKKISMRHKLAWLLINFLRNPVRTTRKVLSSLGSGRNGS